MGGPAPGAGGDGPTGSGHDHADARYLTAKRSVDDRARSRRVRDRLLAALPAAPRVLEAGPGAGATPATLAAWGVEPSAYLGVDADPGTVALARDLAPRLLRRAGRDAVDAPDGCRLDGTPVRFEAGDALDRLPEAAPADLVVAQSFLDLVPVERALDVVAAAAAPGGLAYLPITFDGVTLFQPDHPADDAVAAAYHRDLDATAGRDSRAGRHALDALRARPGRLLAVGASDWIVRPVAGGGGAGSEREPGGHDPATGQSYPADERYFLSAILGFVADALAEADVPEGDDWLAARRRQLDRAELTYVAHGYDLLWRLPP